MTTKSASSTQSSLLSKTDKFRKSQMFGDEVKKKCMELNITPKALSTKIGRAYDPVRKVYKGETFPGPNMLKSLCKVLNLDLEEMQDYVNADKAVDKGWIQYFMDDDPILIELKRHWKNLSDGDRQDILDSAKMKSERNIKHA